MRGTSRDSGFDIVALSAVAGFDEAARQFPSFAEAGRGSLQGSERARTSREHAAKLIDYFEALNSGDLARWERAFRQTWHPEGIVDGRNVAALRDRHRRRLLTGRIEHIHIVGVVRDIDAYRVEFTTESEGKREGPFVATFRDGRVYRLL